MYLDESGHPHYDGLQEDRPILCIAGCVFENQYYSKNFVPTFENLKKKYFGSECVILTSRKIRQHSKECQILNDNNVRESFYVDLNKIMSRAEYVIISTVIFKEAYSKTEMSKDTDPYHLSIKFIMERFQYFLQPKHSVGEIIPEARGGDFDKNLTNQYSELIVNGSGFVSRFDRLKPNCHCRRKTDNIPGLQIADLVAYPTGQKYYYPYRSNPAYDVIESKYYSQAETGKIEGYGIKPYPSKYTCYQYIDF